MAIVKNGEGMGRGLCVGAFRRGKRGVKMDGGVCVERGVCGEGGGMGGREGGREGG